MTPFNKGFAERDGLVFVYLYDTKDGVFFGTSEVYVSEGCGLAPGQALDEPPSGREGYAVVRINGAWELIEDHRGVVYRTSDGSDVTYVELGELPRDLTSLPRPGPAYKWDGTTWVFDQTTDLYIKSQQELVWRDSELSVAGKEILKHEDSDPSAISSEEAWRAYRVDLRAWPQSSKFPNINERPLTPVS
jgi:hypothetical protein